MFKIKVNTTVLAILCSTAIEVNGAANINTIMNTEIKAEQTTTEPELVNELCVFSCKLQRIGGPTLTEINKGLDDLYFLLRAKYGLNSEVTCKLYHKVKANSPTEMRIQPPLPQGNGNVNFYSENILKDRDTWSFFSAETTYKLGSNGLGMNTNMVDLGDDIYFDLIAVALLNHPELNEEGKNNYIKTFQQRHKFIEKSCGEKFMIAYDKYLDKVSELREEQYKEEEKKKQAVVARKEAKKQQIQQNTQERMQRERMHQEASRDASAKSKAKVQCEQSNPYKLYSHSNYIVNAYSSIKFATKNLEREDRVSAIGGATNLANRHQQATIIDRAKTTINNSYAEYKKLGGKATGSTAVTRLSNPCN